MSGPPAPARDSLISTGAAAVAWFAVALFILYGSLGAPSMSGEHAAELPGISLPDILQNVLLYVPFGVFGAWCLRASRPALLRRSMTVIALAIGYSIAMEMLQTFSAARIPSIADVVANIAGASFGVLGANPAEQILQWVSTWARAMGLFGSPAGYALAAVLVALVLVAWYPFDITLDISTLSERTRPVRRDPWLRPGMWELWGHAARYFVVAALAVVAIHRAAKHPVLFAIAAAISAALVIDVGQVAMGAHAIGVAAFGSQSAGACAGAIASSVVLRTFGTRYAAA